MLVRLRDGVGTPLFCIHHSGGDVGIYRKLATRLAPGRTVIGVQSRLEIGATMEFPTIDAMANSYASLIGNYQPLGDVHLLGFSFGGFVATLIAEQLNQAGRNVSFLGLVDSNLGWIQSNHASRAELRIRLMQLFKKFQSVGVMNSKPQEIMRRDIAILVDACLCSDVIQPAEILKKTETMGYVPNSDTVVKMLGEFTFKFITHCRLLKGFAPNPITELMHLWWPSEARQHGDSYSQWSDFSLGNVTQSTISGSHYSIMRMPHVRQLALEVDAAIKNATDRRPIASKLDSIGRL